MRAFVGGLLLAAGPWFTAPVAGPWLLGASLAAGVCGLAFGIGTEMEGS